MKRLFLIFLILLLPVAGWGATIVAKPDATNPTTAIMYKTGNLTNCSDADGTFTTTGSDLYTAAYTGAGASGTLSICSGTYSGSMVRAASAAWVIGRASQTINGAGQSNTILDGTGYAANFIDVSAASPTFSNLTIQNVPDTRLAIYGRTNALTITDVTFTGNDIPFSIGANATLTRVKVIRNLDATQGGGSVTAGTLTCNNCWLEGNSGPLYISGATTVGTFNNTFLIGSIGIAINAVTSGIVLNINNMMEVANVIGNGGSYPISATAGVTINISNSDTLPSGPRPEIGPFSATGTFNLTSMLYTQPYFVSPRRFGWVSLFIDDDANWPHFKNVADYANSKGVGITYCAENTDSGIDATQYTEMATYIAAGNEIAGHVRYTHSDLTNMNAVTFATTAANPHLDIAVTQTDASSANWTGTVTVGDDGSANTVININNTTTITALVNSVKARTGWSGTAVHASATAGSKAITLDNVVNRTTFPYTALFEQDKFWYYEIAEHKKALETGIGGGYVVKTYCYPNNTNNATLQAWVATDANFTAAGTTAFLIARGNTNNNSGTYSLADDLTKQNSTKAVGMNIMEVYNTDETYFPSANQTRDVDAFATFLAYIGGYGMIYSHGALSYSVALWSSMIDRFLASPGITIILPRDAANTIRTSGLWTDADSNGLRWTRTFTDAANYHLQSTSPAINAGVNVGLTTDYEGNTVPTGLAPDIGAYEFVKLYSRGNYATLPADDTVLETAYTYAEQSTVATDDNLYITQTNPGTYLIHQFQENAGNRNNVTVTWKGKSNLAPSTSAVVLQVYNQNSTTWETLTSNNTTGANTEFTLTNTISGLTNYKNSNSIVSWRVYQQMQ